MFLSSFTFYLSHKINCDSVLYKLRVSLLQTDQGIKCLMADKAAELAGSNPDYALQDLYNAIEEGNYPSWTLYIQVMTFDEAERFKWNPFDLTKV